MPQPKVAPGYSSRIEPSTWHAMNRNHMQEWVAKTFRKTNEDKDIENACVLFNHQHIVKDFLQPSSPYRGLLLMHGLGTGKTRGSIAIAEVLSSEYKIAVLVPASLLSNYTEEIKLCGNAIFRKTGKWSFVSENRDEYKQEYKKARKLGVSKKAIEKHKGVWIRAESGTMYNELHDSDQAEISKQIDEMIQHRYSFIHYNGLTKHSIQSLANIGEGNSPFDNHVIIIDEVHNLVSRISNGSDIATQLYKMIITAKNAKVILLSGTPIINRPVELGILANLVRGYMRQIVIEFSSTLTQEQWDNIEDWLSKHKRVDYHEANRAHNSIRVYPLVDNFEWANKEKYLVQKIKKDATDDIKNEIEKHLLLLKIFRKVKLNENPTLLFPDKDNEFDKLFIDYKEVYKTGGIVNPVKNPLLMSRRLQGIISYFESFDRKQFPSVSQTKLVKVQMHDEMFKKYVVVRQEEISKEAKSRIKKTNELNTGNIYRAFTRAMCNFTFPSTIKRAFPSTLKMLKEEMDDDSLAIEENSDDNIIPTENKARDDTMSKYQQQLTNAMKELKKRGTEYLQGEGLDQWGPKYSALLDNLHALKRPALVYSQFRNVEGLGILCHVLDQAGYVEFKIHKTKSGDWELGVNHSDWLKPKYVVFTGDKERNKLIMSAFNNDFAFLPQKLLNQMQEFNGKSELTNLRGELIRVMMITQSGAEGISLKNVRQVHILEPYWNEIRVKQVIGRAVRAGSHLQLPPSEQHVDVYMYMVQFSESQKKHSKVLSSDKGQTSDEYIYDIATKKSKITNALLEIIKSSAVDCVVHRHAHKNIECANIPDSFGEPIQGVLYSYKSPHEDPSDDTLKKQTKTVVQSRAIGFLKCIHGSRNTQVRIPYFKDTMQALNPGKFNVGVYDVIGAVVLNEDGNPIIIPFEDA